MKCAACPAHNVPSISRLGQNSIVCPLPPTRSRIRPSTVSTYRSFTPVSGMTERYRSARRNRGSQARRQALDVGDQFRRGLDLEREAHQPDVEGDLVEGVA